MIHQEVFPHHVFLNAEEVQGLPEDLAELDILADGELTRDAAFLGSLGSVDNDLLGRGHVGGQQDGGIHLC